MKERRYDIDWLRVIAMLAVFIYHCTRFFDIEGWHLKNAEQSLVVTVLATGLVWPWVMELFFLLSGVGAWYALKSRTGGQFLWERVKRLLIPLYTVGLFILLPIQFYFEIYSNEGYRGTFWEMLPRYFSGLGHLSLDWPGDLLPFPFSGHLWFLLFLFLISVVTLPLLLYLKSERGLRWIDRVAGWCDRRGGIFLFVIPLALILIAFTFLASGRRSWADFLWYGTFFVIGYIMVADNRFTESVKRYGWLCLGLWLVGFFGAITYFALVLDYDPTPGNEPFSLIYVLFQIVWSITSWSAVVFVLSLGAKYLNFNNKVLAYGNEAVLPFYLLHQTVILCVGWFVIPWDMGMLPKFLIITVASFALIMALYELLIRRFNIVRFFFGMRPKKKSQATPAPHLEGTSA
jgi:peptidoglycan/LPS O-acetylase OafA/YrhL